MGKKGVKKEKSSSPSSREIQLALIENFVNLQKVLTNMSIKFDHLSENISRLLNLFELSAQSFMRKTETGVETVEDKDVLKKLDTLLDQNKTIAKGLTLIEEKIRHKVYGDSSKDEHPLADMGLERFRHKPRPLPRL